MLCLLEKGKSNVSPVNIVLAGNQVLFLFASQLSLSLFELCFFEVVHVVHLIPFFTFLQGKILKALLQLLTMLEQITLNYPRWLSGSERRT